jgi:hypothetical protein
MYDITCKCNLSKVRAKDDGINSFLSGAATSMILGANGNYILNIVMTTRQLLASGMGGGTMCYVFYKVFKMLGY